MNKRQPIYKRQRFLLSFIRQLNAGVSLADLQKLVFLQLKRKSEAYYDFLPHAHGPHSFQLAEDVDILLKNGFITIEDTNIKATGYSLKENSSSGNVLIRELYNVYPYGAMKNEGADHLFHKEKICHLNNEKQKNTASEERLFTIGYEGKSIEQFIKQLIQEGIKLLCDVRKNPLSRKFGFSKTRLTHITESVGIKYVHVPALGIETTKRRVLKTSEDYISLFNDYAKTLPKLEAYLNQVYYLLHSYTRIALMCFEKDPAQCHRHVVRDYLIKTHKVGSTDL
ncbi:MAG: DUF488 family protein [Candidatus Hydrogenedentales bacterium]|jgi:uncharacterized protein YwgA